MVSQWLHEGLNFIKEHPNFGMFFAFFVSFIESLPIIGTIFPGSLTMTAVGTLIGTEAIPFVATMCWAISGAFTGDLLGYYTGKYGDNFIRQH